MCVADCIICDIVGWSNPPGKPTFNVVELTENTSTTYYYASIHVNITWSTPQYLGGLNANDIYYQLNTMDHNINTTDPYSVLSYDELSLIDKSPLDITVEVHYNGSTTNTLYIPSNIQVTRQSDNLLCDAVGK